MSKGDAPLSIKAPLAKVAACIAVVCNKKCAALLPYRLLFNKTIIPRQSLRLRDSTRGQVCICHAGERGILLLN